MEGHLSSRIQNMRRSSATDSTIHLEPSSPILSFINDKLILSSEVGELMENVVNKLDSTRVCYGQARPPVRAKS